MSMIYVLCAACNLPSCLHHSLIRLLSTPKLTGGGLFTIALLVECDSVDLKVKRYTSAAFSSCSGERQRLVNRL